MTSRLVVFATLLLIHNVNICDGSVSKTADADLSQHHPICREKTCVPKCCPSGQHVYKKKSCVKYNNDNYTLDFSEMSVYNKDRTKVMSNVNESVVLIPASFRNATFKANAYDVYRLKSKIYLIPYIVEDGMFYVEFPNSYRRWLPNDAKHFCVDYQILIKAPDQRPVAHVWALMEEDDSSQSNIYLTSAILVSCVFLLIVLVVYALLPELRNLCGMILMAYVFSLFWAFLLLGVIQITKHEENVCIALTCSIYYFFLATFCWMNVMSYDIWWTFRGYAKARPIHRRGEMFKFLMYSLYGFGLPLAMTAFLYIMNNIDLRDKGWIVKPYFPRHACFIDGGEKLLYLYMPMLILIISNWILYLMTAFNVWRLSRGTAVLDSAAAGNPAAHRTHWNRFMVYLKLSVVMGLNWVFEVISFLIPGLRVWNITDAYNILIGLSIFLIFVCKKKIFKKLVKRYKMASGKNDRGYPSTKSTSSTTSDCSSQETSLPLVCTNPKGPVVQVKI